MLNRDLQSTAHGTHTMVRNTSAFGARTTRVGRTPCHLGAHDRYPLMRATTHTTRACRFFPAPACKPQFHRAMDCR